MGHRWSTAARSSNRSNGRAGRSFFDRPTTQVARDLLGRELHAVGPDGHRSVQLVEVEAYVAGDPASHAFRGPTARNRSMFRTPGTLYVFRIHQVVCANLVTRPGEAVLLRAGFPLDVRVGNPSGPGRLCRYLGITLADDGLDASAKGRVYVAGAREPSLRTLRSPRVGISRAVDRPLRFSVSGNPWVSRPRPGRTISATSPSRSPGGGPYRRTRTRSRPPSGGGRSGGRTVGR
jgi:DNA-3-methyladenine glycosylase